MLSPLIDNFQISILSLLGRLEIYAIADRVHCCILANDALYVTLVILPRIRLLRLDYEVIKKVTFTFHFHLQFIILRFCIMFAILQFAIISFAVFDSPCLLRLHLSAGPLLPNSLVCPFILLLFIVPQILEKLLL